MTSAEMLAILMSAVSAAIALFALGWNVYRDVVAKPRLRVKVFVADTFVGGEAVKASVCVSAVNLGPGRVTCNLLDVRAGSLLDRILRKAKHMAIVHDHRDPACSQVPAVLEPGDTVRLVVPYDAECFLSTEPDDIGISDSFDRSHWAPRKHVREAIEQWRKDHGGAKSTST